MTLYPPSVNVWTEPSLETATEVDAKFPRKAWTSTYPGHGEIYPAKRGEANRGQYAIDFMIENKAQGDAIAAYVWANRKRLGVRYVIWNKRIISETRDGKWHTYVNPVPSRRGTASGDHTNHVHASRYSNGHYVAPTQVDPQPPHVGYPTPKTHVVYADKIKPGQTDSDSVFWVQVALGVQGTGTYDKATVEAAKAFQQSLGDDVDGDLGPLQLAALFKAHPDLGISVEAHS